MSAPLNVTVIGAGIVGAATALRLAQAGHRVTILEPGQPGGEQSASYGNGCWLSPSSVVPMSLPGIAKKVPGFLRDPLGPLAIRPSYLPRMAGWLWRFIAAGSTVAKVERTARALRPLVEDAPAQHAAIAADAGVGHLIHRQGILYIFPDRAAFEAEALAWRLRRDNGVQWLEIEADELRQREPALDRRYSFAVLVEAGGHCSDPGLLVGALVRAAQQAGAVVRSERARGFRVVGGRLTHVRTEAGLVPADRAVIAAGAHSRTLAAQVGDAVPLETERGYHAQILDPPEGAGPRTPTMPSDGKMSITRMAGGLRCAGQVELAGLEAAPNWQRAAILRDFLLKLYPDLPRDLPAEWIKVWMGHRPSIADGLPVIGPARDCRDVVHAFGHGHVGLAAGPKTAAWVSALIEGRDPGVDLSPYSAQRF
jgi:D-amino-acid dehydrogenase